MDPMRAGQSDEVRGTASVSAPMSSRKDTVLACFDGFRRCDHAAILDLVTEDAVGISMAIDR